MIEEYEFGEQEKKIRAYLKKMVEIGGSDLHLRANAVIRVRIDGDIKEFAGGVLSSEDVKAFAKEILRGRYEEFIQNKEIDFVYPFNERYRFRANMFFQVDGISAVFRVIPMEIPSFDDLKLPEVLKKFTEIKNGLVLVTGITGSGKSTTLATLIDMINRSKSKHIITIEDPVEFVHKPRGCVVNQRSVGQDTLSFKNALKSALREDPDIILVGEMRDIETINLALHAADTGHLVFSTLHTIDSKETINRIIAQFPPEEQHRVRDSLSNVIQGIVSQRLVKTVDNKRRAAMEVLVRTPMVQKLIKENRDSEIRDAMEEGKQHYGSQTFDQSLLDLYNDGIISEAEALGNATSASDMKLKMSGVTGGMSSKNSNSDQNQAPVIDETSDDIYSLQD